MSHKTTFKRRLGAALTSLATAAALAVPLAVPAGADHGPALTVDPMEDSAAVGTCNAFTVTIVDGADQPDAGQFVRIVRDHDDPAATDADLAFCTPETDGNDVQTLEDDGTTPEGDDEGVTAEGTDENGQLTFGIASELTGQETLTIYVDENANGDFDAGEQNATAVKTWTAGGADAVTTVDAEPEDAVNFIGETHTVTVTVTNAAGDPVPGVKVEMEITGDGSPNQGTTDGTDGVESDPADAMTDNDGQVSFGYSSDTFGEDTIAFWVDQSGGTADARDTDEPADEVTKSWVYRGEAERLHIEGGDRHATAVAASRDLFPTDESATNVVLARSTDYPDALSGTPLAVQLGAPMLLTPDPTATPADWVIHPVTEAEIDRLLTPNTGDTVYILGGEVAVGADVEQHLMNEGYDVQRIEGITRIETAVAIAETITGLTGPDAAPESIFVTTGYNFPDALTAGAAAVEANGVVVLSAGDDPAPATTEYLDEHDAAARYAIGGPAARAYDDRVQEGNELVGTGRYETAMLVVERFWPNGHPQVGVARADVKDGQPKFPDALSGGTHIGHYGGPLILTEPDRLLDENDGNWAANGTQSPEEYLEEHADVIMTAYVYGGSAAIFETTADEIENAIRGIE